MKRLAAALCLACLLSQPTPASADSTTDAARILFEEGRELLDQGRLDEACASFEKSQALVPATGTLLNLGLCHKRAGRLATARSYYLDADASARKDAERAQVARAEAMELERAAAKLTLSVLDRADAGLEITIDGKFIPRDQWGVPIYLDAGERRIEARSAGRRSWSEVVLARDGVDRLLTVPALQPEEVPQPTAATTPELREPEPTGWNDQQIAGASVAGAGLVAGAAAIVFTVLASNAFSDSKSASVCTRNDVCNARGRELRADADKYANWGTAMTGISVAAIAGGALLFFTAPDDTETLRAQLRLDGAGLTWSF